MNPALSRGIDAADRRSPFTYELYGLCLVSDWAIPGLHEASPRAAQITLRTGEASGFAEAHSSLPPGPRNWFNRTILRDGSEYLLWSTLFEFLISPDGSTVVVRVLEQGTPEALEIYLFGQVLSFVLIKRGIEPVHGTAVVIDGKAIAVVGDSAYGKSTLAAAFLSAGFSLLTDDLLVTSVVEGVVVAHPGPPRLKLLPESARLLGEGISGSRMNPYTTKFIVPLAEGFSYRRSAPLARVYVLSDPDAEQHSSRIRALSGHEACIELLRNTSNTKVQEPSRNQQLLRFYSELSTRVPVRALAYPREFSILPEVVNAIVADLRAETE